MTEINGGSQAAVSAENVKKQFLVVGIGGSAGAIGSFREFFRHVPADSGMAYVVILHLSPDHESHLAEVVQAAAKIPVVQVREQVHVAPDHVYVIPPNKSLALDDGTLVLSSVTSFEERRAPIDIFFRTLAVSHDSRAVCVVMSGSGSDGTMGLRRVKEYNGLVVVQDPTEAAFGEMPRNCIATGLVDFVVPAAEMPGRILHYRDQLRTLHVAEETARPETDDEQALMEVYTILRLRTGHDFINYKRPTVLRRIERRMAIRDMATLPAYAGFLRERNDEAHALLAELLISVTNFFRDCEVWEKVERDIIPKLVSSKGPEDHLRVWVPGCATGEEAYSIAMLLAEKGAQNVQIFATDLDQQAIVRAREGWYSETEIADVTPERLRRFFLKDGEGYRVRRDLREMVLFAHHNVIKDPPFSHLDFISCRNLLIYLNRAAQQRTLEVMHFALERGGYLLLGTAEAVDSSPSLFSLVDKEAHLYQSRGVERAPLVAPLPRATAPIDVRALLTSPSEPPPLERRVRDSFAPIDLHHQLLEQYAPPSVVVDELYHIVHLSERAHRYLQVPRGEATSNVLHMVRQELRIDLRSALFQATQKRTTVAARNLEVHAGDRPERIDLIVSPALNDEDPSRGYFLVVFEQANRRDDEPAREAMAVEPGTRSLEDELLRVKGQMRSTIEQYEVQVEEAKAANEELQAMNEELRSTAEELETSQEELQSVNEELQTVNQELKVKIDEISHAGDDLRNLMTSTEIATIFVDRSLRVKLFTPRAREVFNLIAADVGRPLSDITNRLVLNDLAEEMAFVLDRLQTVEREVQTADDCWFLMRLLPYRTSEDRIDGVVLTFLDVTERHKSQEALRKSEERQAYLVRLSDALRPLDDPAAVKREALRVAGEQLGVDRAFYAEITPDGESIDIGDVYRRPNVPPISGRFPTATWRFASERLRAGNVLAIADVFAAPEIGDAEREAYAGIDVRSAIAVPLVKQGKWMSNLGVFHRTPRQWTTDEIEVLRDTAERTWGAVERAMAIEELRASEARETFLVRLGDAVRTRTDVDEIERITTQMLVEHLGVTQAHFAHYTETVAEVRFESRRGEHSFIGRYPLQQWPAIVDVLRSGRPVVVSDPEAAWPFSPDERARWEDRGVVSKATVPILRNGTLLASLSICDSGPRTWSAHQVELLVEIAQRTWEAIEHARTETALRNSEEEYRSLFNSMNEGFAVCEIVRDDAGRAVDYRVLVLNHAFDSLIGIRREQAYPGISDRGFIERYAQVVETAVPLRFEEYVSWSDRWYDIRCYPRGGDRFALLYDDITARKRVDAALRTSEARQTYLVRLADALRPHDDPAAIQREALRVLGDHLDVDRMLYVEITPDGQRFTIDENDNYIRGDFPQVVGELPIAGFPAGAAALQKGETLRVDDVNTAAMSAEEKAEFLALRVVSTVAVPLIKRGRWLSSLWVQHGSPRSWSDDEVALIRKTAERTWAAVERARAEAALRENEEKYRTLFETMDEGYILCDVIFDEDGRPYDVRYVEANPAAVRMTGTELIGKTMREISPDFEEHWFETWGRVARTGVAERHEFAARPLSVYYSFYVFKVGPADSPRVAAVYEDVTERRRAQEALSESEKRLQAITNLVPDLLWTSDANGRTTWYNERWLEYTGQTLEEALESGWTAAIHPEDRTQSAESYRSAVAEGSTLQQERRIRSRSGEYRWFLLNALPFRDDDGRVVRYYGAATEMHEQRLAREQLEERVRERTQALLELSGNRQQLLERLVTVTEEERQRIARELHDEMGQHITALRVRLESFPHERVGELKNIIIRLDQSLDRLTLELRPPALDQLGLHGAISSLADEFSTASGIRVALHLGLQDTDRFPDGIESALYRVVQESLTNVWKHASAKTVSVILERDRDALRMIVEDDGQGFDADGAAGDAPVRGRFGLLGMRERLGLVGGTFKVESQAGSGATIYVRVPLLEVAESDA
jgi:two-component system CheB/CheR fusion protein